MCGISKHACIELIIQKHDVGHLFINLGEDLYYIARFTTLHPHHHHTEWGCLYLQNKCLCTN